MAMDLINIFNASEVIGTLEPIALSNPSKSAVAATILTLTEIQRAFNQDGSLAIFHPDRLLVLPPRAKNVQPPSEEVSKYLFDLAVLANKAAESLACSSILAGHSSESDDTSDVAVWLGQGDYGPGKEGHVLDVLELTPWLEQGAKISNVDLSLYEHTLPSTLTGSVESPEAQACVKKLGEMTDRHCFRVVSPTTAPVVVFFLLGRFTEEGSSEWGGLVGIGTWSDQ